MKKMMLTAMVLGMTASVAGAQTWPTESGQFKLTSCYGTKDGVQCDFSYELIKKQTIDLDISSSEISAFTGDGNKVNPTISLAGKDWSSYPPNLQVYNGTPVKVSLLFNLPANTTSLASIAIGDENIKNIPVRPFGVPAPVAAPAASAQAPAQAINIVGNWNATLTNCRQSTAGPVVCVAVLRK